MDVAWARHTMFESTFSVTAKPILLFVIENVKGMILESLMIFAFLAIMKCKTNSVTVRGRTIH